jgi:hypothetical protein
VTVRQVLPEREPTVDAWGSDDTRVEPVTWREPVSRTARQRGAHRTGPLASYSAGQGYRSGQPPRRNAGGQAGSQGGGNRRPRRYGRLTSVAILGLVATVAGGGFAGISYLAAHSGSAAKAGAVTLHAGAVSSLSGASGVDGAATAMPGLVSVPQFASAPSATGKSPKADTSGSPSPAPSRSSSAPAAGSSASHSPAPTTAPSSAASPRPPSPTASAPAAGGGGACTNPVFSTTSLYGTYTNVPYYVANDMWNVGSSNASQTLNVCSYSDWSVTANVSGGGNGVKTYPNSQRDFSNAPAISSLNSITSTFADSIPDSGTFETAYDIWLNAIANPSAGSDEVMIWTNNHGQIPGGSPQGTVTFDGVTYTAWKGDGNYFAFVANSAFTSGSVNLLDFFKWLMAQNWIPGNSTLVQVDYGVEVVSTNGPETFSFNNFSVNAS